MYTVFVYKYTISMHKQRKDGEHLKRKTIKSEHFF